MTMTLTPAETDYLSREITRLEEKVELFEDQLSLLYPQQEKLHELTRVIVRGPQPRLLRQQHAVDLKITDAERRLILARSDLRSATHKLGY